MSSFLPPEGRRSPRRRLALQATKRWLVLTAAPAIHWIARRRPAEMERWSKALSTGSWPVALATRTTAIPNSVWWFVNRYLLENTPVASLEKLVDSGVDLLLVCGPPDYQPLSLGVEGRIRRLQQSNHFRLVLLEQLDHSAWVMEQRKVLIDALVEHLVTTYGLAPSTQSASAGRRTILLEILILWPAGGGIEYSQEVDSPRRPRRRCAHHFPGTR